MEWDAFGILNLRYHSSGYELLGVQDLVKVKAIEQTVFLDSPHILNATLPLNFTLHFRREIKAACLDVLRQGWWIMGS